MSEIRKKQGPPVKYRVDYARQARVVCAEGGFTDIKLARLFGVCKATIGLWKRKYPEFKQAVREGKEVFDNTVVEAALLKRALGYKYAEITKEPDPDTGKMATTKIIRKNVPGDVKAQVFWLRNRSRERWPDTLKFNGDLNVKISHEEMLDKLE